MKKHLIFFISIFFMLSNCNNKEKAKQDEDCGKIEELASKKMKQYGRDVIFNSTYTSNVIKTELFIKSPSFLDMETQKLILSVLAYEMYSCYRHFEKVEYIYNDEGFEHEPLYFTHTRAHIELYFNEYSNNEMFVNLLKYSMKNMSQEEVLASNNIIKELNKIVPDLFYFKGSFWMLLHSYSKNIDKKDSQEYKNFGVFIKAASVKGSHVNKDHLQKISEICAR